MKLYADENFPRLGVVQLRNAGLDLLWTAETHPGLPDEAVLAECMGTGRTLLTFDKDFGELAYRWGLPSDCGVVLFRLDAKTPEEMADLLFAAVRARQDWSGHFSVVTRQRIRMRPFHPSRPGSR